MNRVPHTGFMCLAALMAILAPGMPAQASETASAQTGLTYIRAGWAVGVQTLTDPVFCSTEGDDSNSDSDNEADIQPSSDADPADDGDPHDNDDDVTATDDHPSNEKHGDDREPLTSR